MGNNHSKPLLNKSLPLGRASRDSQHSNPRTGTSSAVGPRSGTLTGTMTLEPNYSWVDGRRFFDDKDIHYVLPNDVEEIDRLVMQHFILQRAFGANYQAPVKDLLESGIKVLDVG
ncbi:hypothetical protein BC938DRAFT_471875 [Jimgerdemannia flammicorona]|uniref:Uncharacterized protein n=1 Tax=Jimgerdemannia flammicorona TaxID=994334 RepID=A0A433Q790_9FUNG|nr:hypothetical protein BC938DRAFT_471875 [Jimgerdemannia flammicorona]